MRRRPPYPGAVPLFGEVEEATVGMLARNVTPGAEWTVRYRPIRRVACDDCVMYLHENKGKGPLPLAARHRRRLGEEDLRLCTPHADVYRRRDGLKTFAGDSREGKNGD